MNLKRLKSISLALSIIVFILLFILLSTLLYTEPEKDEYIVLSTVIETKSGIDLICRNVFENYKEGEIIMTIEFKKEEENDNKIYLNIHPSINLPEDFLDETYLELSYPNKKRVDMEGKDGSYYFDLSESSKEDSNAQIYIKVGKDFFPDDFNRIIYSRYLSFNKLTKIKENTPIQLLFSSDWDVVFCNRSDDFTELNIGKHRITSKAQNPQGVDYFIELERYDDTGLKLTRYGIMLTIFGIVLSIISLIPERE